jgi:hypothetical protein
VGEAHHPRRQRGQRHLLRSDNAHTAAFTGELEQAAVVERIFE